MDRDIRYLHDQLLPVFKHGALKGKCHAQQRAAHVKGNDLRLYAALFHPCQCQQVLDQPVCALHFGLYVGKGLALRQFICQHLGIGTDDGQGRFQLMACIPDELLLFFHGFVHGTDHAADQQDGAQAEQRVLQQGGQHGQQQDPVP